MPRPKQETTKGFKYLMLTQRSPPNPQHIEVSVKPGCWRGPLPRRPHKPPKVELQTVHRARVYYARGGFHPENCTGCFSGPDRVNSSSCALPAGEACVRARIKSIGSSVFVRARVSAVGVELTGQATLKAQPR